MQLIKRHSGLALAALSLAFAKCAAEPAVLYPTMGGPTTFERGATAADTGSLTFDAGDIWASSDGYFRLEFKGTAKRNFNVYVFISSYAGEGATGRRLSGYVDGFDCSQVNVARDYRRVYRVEPGSRSVRITFFDATKAENVKVTAATEADAVAFGDGIWSEVNKDSLFERALAKYPVPKTAFDWLPKFKAALAGGAPFKVHLLGDSIAQDTFASPFRALIRRAYPNSNLAFTMHAEGSTGCPKYAKDEFRAIVPDDTDLLVICGIDNFAGNGFTTVENAAKALGDVIQRAKDAGMEILYLSPMKSYDSRGITDEAVLTDVLTSAGVDGRNGGVNIWYAGRSASAWDRSADIWAKKAYHPAERNAVLEAKDVQCWDVFPLVQEVVSQSGRPYGWFNRDPAHNNVYGKELIARTFLEYVKAAQ